MKWNKNRGENSTTENFKLIIEGDIPDENAKEKTVV